MKKIFAFIVALVFLSGCATDGFYQAGKTVYIAGKKVVVANWDELPEETKEKLKAVDTVAKKYDSARKVMKPALEEAAKEVKKLKSDVNSTSIKNQKHR